MRCSPVRLFRPGYSPPAVSFRSWIIAAGVGSGWICDVSGRELPCRRSPGTRLDWLQPSPTGNCPWGPARSGRMAGRGSKKKSPEGPQPATRPRWRVASPERRATPATSRSSAMRAPEATRVNLFRSQASRSLAGAPRGESSAEIRMLVSRTMRIRTVERAAGSVSRGPLRRSRQSSSAAEFRGNIGESLAGLADGLMKNPPADGFLDEFREIAFFHALHAQKGAQGMIGLFGTR